jgi:16S rRNA (guanine1207-N2)-methyltransferase
MSDHYYSKKPESQSNPNILEMEILGQTFKIVSDSGVFSKKSLDKGTETLIKAMPILPTDRVLDWGCGYGIIGLVAATLGKEVEMIDINERAIKLANENIRVNKIKNACAYQSDGFQQVKSTFDIIVSNPPFRAGKKVVHGLVEEAPLYLVPNGRLCIVVQRKQGAESLAKKMNEVFGNVETLDRSGGYRVLLSQKLTN